MFRRYLLSSEPLQTERLYQTAIDAAHLTGKETVIDAYSGIGTISLSKQTCQVRLWR